MRPYVHLLLHILVPGIVARVGFPDRWRRAWLIMVLTMVVDADHLIADPLYDPNRCSIGFHPLHSPLAIAVYGVMALISATRIVGVGLRIHVALDLIDCACMGAM